MSLMSKRLALGYEVEELHDEGIPLFFQQLMAFFRQQDPFLKLEQGHPRWLYLLYGHGYSLFLRG